MDFFRSRIFYDSLKMLKMHAYTACFGSVLAMLLMGMFEFQGTGFKVIAVLYLLIYLSIIYQTAWRIAFRDKKLCYTTAKCALNGAVISAGILVLNYLLWLLYIFSWKFLAIDGRMVSGTGTIYNLLYVVDTFMYRNFAEISKGVVSWQAHLMIIFAPTIMSVLGSVLGSKGFDLSEKLMPFIYEKKSE